MGQPLYQKIAESLERQIREGDLHPGAQIPPQLELASQHGVSVMTIQKALALLVADGLIYRIRKRGSFVAQGGKQFARDEIDSPVRRVYFVHNRVTSSTLSLDIHRACLQGMSAVCEEYGLPFEILNLRDRFRLPQDRDAGFVLWGFSGYEDQYPHISFLNAVEGWQAEGRYLTVIHQYFRHIQIPHVNGDNFAGAYLATKHLLSLGHKRIGIILTGKSKIRLNPEFVIRLQGYRMALHSEGIEFEEDLMFVQDDGPEEEESGYAGLRALMERSARPTAVFATTDVKALGVLYAAADMGLSVPDELSVMGYDGYQFGALVSPALTTVDQDFASLGKQAVHVLRRTFTGESSETLIAPKLVLRNSTGSLQAVARNV